MRYFVTGGVKSGKSSRVLSIARSEFPKPISFLATAEILDEEMRVRIERHRAERKASDGIEEFKTIEESLELDTALLKAGQAVIIDCLPMWINNLMHYGREAHFHSILEAALKALPPYAAIVSNETGLGNIPFDEATRRYNLLLAEANRRFAEVCDHVEFMVSGIPLKVK